MGKNPVSHYYIFKENIKSAKPLQTVKFLTYDFSLIMQFTSKNWFKILIFQILRNQVRKLKIICFVNDI